MAAELVLTRGLPGSGKSTGAEMFASVTENTVVIGRDLIRLDVLRLATTKGTHEQEDLVTALHRAMVENALLKGWNVVVDDTCLPQKRARDWAELAATCRAKFRVVDYTTVPLEDCLANNAQRIGTVKHVPEDVIKGMHQRYLASGNFVADIVIPEASEKEIRQYVADEKLPQAFIFDIDGTLAEMQDRGPFEWQKVGQDTLHSWVAQIAWALRESSYAIVYLSGRDGSCARETLDWLDKHGLPEGPLYMRAPGDNRKDSLVKVELFWTKVAPEYHVVGVFDDRNQVVEAWRAMGLPVAQVAEGNF